MLFPTIIPRNLFIFLTPTPLTLLALPVAPSCCPPAHALGQSKPSLRCGWFASGLSVASSRHPRQPARVSAFTAKQHPVGFTPHLHALLRWALGCLRLWRLCSDAAANAVCVSALPLSHNWVNTRSRTAKLVHEAHIFNCKKTMFPQQPPTDRPFLPLAAHYGGPILLRSPAFARL